MSDLCVVFDIDDTLYLERDYVCSGFAAVGEWAARWLGIPDFAEQCRARHERGQVFNAVLSECGTDASPELVSALVSIYRTHMPSIELCHDALTALTAISREASLAVISDGPGVSQSRKAEALQLERFASPVILTELMGHGCGKPSPAAFQQVERSVSAKRFVYVADNPLKDFTAPAALGWTTIRVRRPAGLHFNLPNTIVEPTFELPDCSQLPKVLGLTP